MIELYIQPTEPGWEFSAGLVSYLGYDRCEQTQRVLHIHFGLLDLLHFLHLLHGLHCLPELIFGVVLLIKTARTRLTQHRTGPTNCRPLLPLILILLILYSKHQRTCHPINLKKACTWLICSRHLLPLTGGSHLPSWSISLMNAW